MLSALLARFREANQLPDGYGLADLRASRRTRPVRVESFTVEPECPLDPVPHLAEIAMARTGNPFLKWWSYFESYETELANLAHESRQGRLEQPLRILEIGVWRGGSLGMWRDYFGPDAVIYGVDIDPESATQGVTDGLIRIGSQTDASFMRDVVDEMGGIDIVIDDGSHVSHDVIQTLRNTWPLLADGGRYFIEDLHTSYWPAWGGGFLRDDSSIEALKTLIDTLHQPYFESRADSRHLGINRDTLKSVTFYDSVAVLHKGRCAPPTPFRGGA